MKRALVVGLGVMGGYHLRVLGQVEGVEVVGGVDPLPERRDALGKPAYATVGEAIRALSPDFAVIAAPAAAMPELAREALEAGVPVMIEKPVGADESDALAVVELAREHGLLLGVGHVERCNPAVIAMKAKLDAGAIGAIYQLHARRLSPFPDRDSMLGVSLDLATHDIDVMRYLTGSEIDRVFAETAQRRHDSAEDLIAATLRFDSGATGLLEVNWLTPTKVRELTVTGERGTFVLNYLTQELSHYEHPTARNEWPALANTRGGGEGDMVRYALQRREPLRVQWEAFLAALDSGGDAMATGYDGYAALSTARAIQRAGRDHSVVRPSYR